jgi:hypothetical protein
MHVVEDVTEEAELTCDEEEEEEDEAEESGIDLHDDLGFLTLWLDTA